MSETQKYPFAMDAATFEKYNPPADVARCPYGRAYIRDFLDALASAAVELYGVISKEEFVDLYNEHFSCDPVEDTDVEEMTIMLLPRVLRDMDYFFYKDYLCNPFLLYFVHADDWINYVRDMQQGKGRYIPPDVDEFLEYQDSYYGLSERWHDARRYLLSHVSDDQIMSVIDDWFDLVNKSKLTFKLNDFMQLLDDYEIDFGGLDATQDFFNILMEANNNSRLWTNNGFTPREIVLQEKLAQDAEQGAQKTSQPPHPWLSEDDTDGIHFTPYKEPGRNDPCPCGSGKKYKKCCLQIQESKTARFSPEDREDFFKLWYGLLEYVNERYKVVPLEKIINWQSDEDLCYALRKKLWEDPSVITGYIASPSLSAEEKETLEMWRDQHISANFLLVEHRQDGSLFLREDSEENHHIYLVKGLRNSIPWAVHARIPAMVQTILLPFREQIVYDGTISTYTIVLGPNFCTMLEEEMAEVGEDDIIKSL